MGVVAHADDHPAAGAAGVELSEDPRRRHVGNRARVLVGDLARRAPAEWGEPPVAWARSLREKKLRATSPADARWLDELRVGDALSGTVLRTARCGADDSFGKPLPTKFELGRRLLGLLAGVQMRRSTAFAALDSLNATPPDATPAAPQTTEARAYTPYSILSKLHIFTQPLLKVTSHPSLTLTFKHPQRYGAFT